MIATKTRPTRDALQSRFQTACALLNIPPDDIRGSQRSASIVRARRLIAGYLRWPAPGRIASFYEMGVVMGMCHSSIVAQLEVHGRLLTTDVDYLAAWEALCKGRPVDPALCPTSAPTPKRTVVLDPDQYRHWRQVLANALLGATADEPPEDEDAEAIVAVLGAMRRADQTREGVASAAYRAFPGDGVAWADLDWRKRQAWYDIADGWLLDVGGKGSMGDVVQNGRVP